MTQDLVVAMSNSQPAEEAVTNVAASAEGRDLLLRRMADLAILPPGRLTPHERDLVDSVIAPAVSRLDVATRRRLAARIAQLPEGPGELTLALAKDEIDVAGLVLRNSQGLQADDLIQIIRETGPAHQSAISQRRSIQSSVVDALIEYAGADAICRLLANAEAEISDRGMEILVRRSVSVPEFQPLLLARKELNSRLAQLMFWWVSPEARREILTRYSVERRMMHAALDGLLHEGVALAKTDDVLQVALSLVQPPVAASRQQVARLIDQANRHQRDEFISEIVFAGRVRPETAFRIFSDLGGEPLAVFAKAIGMTRAEFSDLMVAMAGFRNLDMADRRWIEQVTTIFDVISHDRADFVLHCWDWVLSAEAQVSIDL